MTLSIKPTVVSQSTAGATFINTEQAVTNEPKKINSFPTCFAIKNSADMPKNNLAAGRNSSKNELLKDAAYVCASACTSQVVGHLIYWPIYATAGILPATLTTFGCGSLAGVLCIVGLDATWSTMHSCTRCHF